MQKTIQLCLAALMLSAEVSAVEIQSAATQEADPTQCQQAALDKYKAALAQCGDYFDREEFSQCKQPCTDQACVKQCKADQLGFCWEVAGMQKDSDFFHCGFEDENYFRECTLNVFKYVDRLKYDCLKEHLERDTDPEAAKAECEAQWKSNMKHFGNAKGCP